MCLFINFTEKDYLNASRTSIMYLPITTTMDLAQILRHLHSPNKYLCLACVVLVITNSLATVLVLRRHSFPNNESTLHTPGTPSTGFPTAQLHEGVSFTKNKSTSHTLNFPIAAVPTKKLPPLIRKCVSISVFTDNEAHKKKYAEKVPQMVGSVSKILGGDWEVFVFFDDSVAKTLRDDIAQQANSSGTILHWRKMPPNNWRSGTFWRYYAFDECFLTIFRDCEWEFHENDRWIMKNFSSMPQEFAVMHHAHERSWKDHRPVLGGAYVMKNVDRKINMTQLMHDWPWWHYYGSDEIFLANMVHPKRQSIIYYEPRPHIVKSIKLSGMSKLETYVKLPSFYL